MCVCAFFYSFRFVSLWAAVRTFRSTVYNIVDMCLIIQLHFAWLQSIPLTCTNAYVEMQMAHKCIHQLLFLLLLSALCHLFPAFLRHFCLLLMRFSHVFFHSAVVAFIHISFSRICYYSTFVLDGNWVLKIICLPSAIHSKWINAKQRMNWEVA